MAGLRIAIVGSGFAGSILARILRLQGHQVLLVERGRHPRFALGESSTPLAAICLERLAARYGLEDLHALAAWGRWVERLPHLRRGLKRGFTFYGHEPGRAFANGAANERRLLVAASPADAVADAHWLRADVDHHLSREAAAKGVELLEEVELAGLEAAPGGGWRLSGTHRGRAVRFEADLLVDGSGPAGFLARHLGIASVPTAPRTALVFGHFEGGADFSQIAAAGGAELPAGPYPDEQAAVHHVLAEGWMYVLPFDHGTVSAGFVVAEDQAREELTALAPDRAWEKILRRYPTLQEQFAGARPSRPLGLIPRLQHRRGQAAGEGWAMLPHSFCFLSPLFSTGIAWSLLAVERLALLLEPAAANARPGLGRYGDLLSLEAEHVQRLVGGAYEAMGDFDLFAAYSFLYFAAASFAEAGQRLLPEPEDGWAWQGFLGSTDPVMRETLERTLAALRRTLAGPVTDAGRRRFEEEVRHAIAPRNLAGLAQPERRRLYPVDLAPLVANAGLLGFTPETIQHELPRLRGIFSTGIAYNTTTGPAAS